jgi:hypothetical protein
VRHRHQSQRACARGLRDKPGRALSPPVLGRRCGGSGFATSHNGLLRARPGVRSPRARPPGLRATPVMSCAPPRLQRGQLGTARHARIQKLVRSRLRRHRKGSWSGAASGAVMELAPARPPSAPQGGSLALSTVLPSVAPCSPRQGQALRAREYARP